jgi:hypothetical protein
VVPSAARATPAATTELGGGASTLPHLLHHHRKDLFRSPLLAPRAGHAPSLTTARATHSLSEPPSAAAQRADPDLDACPAITLTQRQQPSAQPAPPQPAPRPPRHQTSCARDPRLTITSSVRDTTRARQPPWLATNRNHPRPPRYHLFTRGGLPGTTRPAARAPSRGTALPPEQPRPPPAPATTAAGFTRPYATAQPPHSARPVSSPRSRLAISPRHPGHLPPRPGHLLSFATTSPGHPGTPSLGLVQHHAAPPPEHANSLTSASARAFPVCPTAGVKQRGPERSEGLVCFNGLVRQNLSKRRPTTSHAPVRATFEAHFDVFHSAARRRDRQRAPCQYRETRPQQT